MHDVRARRRPAAERRAGSGDDQDANPEKEVRKQGQELFQEESRSGGGGGRRRARSQAQGEKGPAGPPDATHRVPAYFGGLGLTDEQKESIYEIQGEYLPQIQALEKKAAELREERMLEIENVLTAPQKKALADARKAASTRRKAAAKAKAGD